MHPFWATVLSADVIMLPSAFEPELPSVLVTLENEVVRVRGTGAGVLEVMAVLAEPVPVTHVYDPYPPATLWAPHVEHEASEVPRYTLKADGRFDLRLRPIVDGELVGQGQYIVVQRNV